MKKSIFLTVLITLCLHFSVLGDSAKVTLKSGAELSGTIISLDPKCCIVLEIAGFETSINMEDVASVERMTEEVAQVSATPSKPVNVNPNAHPAVTHKGTIKTDKNGKQYIEVMSDNGQELTMDYVSKENKTLKVKIARKDYEYTMKDCIIPEYVDLEGEKFTVVEIGAKAFDGRKVDLKSVILPETLQKIGDYAFSKNYLLSTIIIPESVIEIGTYAFYCCGNSNQTFEQIYIPESVKTIGKSAFLHVGPKKSFKGYYQGYLSSAPPFITMGNCTQFGIDEKALEDYYRRKGI